ncbi:MAG: AAA family ATPase [Fibrobacter sp.]|nr:AAA family ATPase [Fibrobacter sp.]
MIKNWLKSDKKAILLTGARQTGKTFLIRHVLESNSQNFVEINFLKSPELLGLLESAKNKDFSAFFTRLQFATRKELTKGKTVIFLDEVQEYKEILTAIKFLVEEGSFRYVLSGSLLGVELTDLRSAPVGYLPVIEMFPMDFEEFLIAQKIPADALARLRENFTDKTPVEEFVHNKILDAFYTYLIVGGMPAAVQEFVDSNDLNAVTRIHKDILKQYNWDFSKYEKERKLHLISTYDLIPSELNSKNKRYMFADLGAKQKFGRYENSFNWLIVAGVAIPTF